jgi:hypothetical protein
MFYHNRKNFYFVVIPVILQNNSYLGKVIM